MRRKTSLGSSISFCALMNATYEKEDIKKLDDDGTVELADDL